MMAVRRMGKGAIGALVMVGSLGVLGISGCSDEEPLSDLPRHDFILVSVDTLRADRMSVYGAERDTDLAEVEWSPAWLATQGTTWEHCWAPAGKTVPALASFWTGVEPLEHGAQQDGTPINWRTFAQTFEAEGYTTLARVANRQLHGDIIDPAGRVAATGVGFHRGFADYAVRAKEDEPKVHRELLPLAKRAIQADEPLMIWAHYMAPHQSYEPAKQHDLYGDADGPIASTDLLKDLHRIPKRLTPEQRAAWDSRYGSGQGPPELTESLRDHLRGKYDGEVRTASEYVSQLLSGLDRQYQAAGRGGLLENATVIFFADHGEELADHHRYFMHAKSLYTGAVRVPLIIAGKGFEAEPGRREASAISLLDVLPMVLYSQARERSVFVSTWRDYFYTVRDERYTLVHAPCDPNKQGPVEPPTNGRFPYPVIGLYDRQTDPTELSDISEQHPEIVERLLGELNAWYYGLAMYSGPSGNAGPDAATMAEMGYVGDNDDEGGCEPWTVAQWKARQ